MKILLVAPMPPQPQAPGAIPLVLYAQLTGLMERHEVTLVTVAGPDPSEWEALDRLQAMGVDVQAIRRSEPHGISRWHRRWRWASSWLKGKIPWRTIWFWEPELQRILNRLLSGRSYDLVIVEDNAMGIYRYDTSTPVIFTEHEVRRPRPINWQARPGSNRLIWAFGEADWLRWRKYQRSVWRRFDCIQVFTPRDAQAVATLAPELANRVRVNPFGIDLPEPISADLEEPGHLLFVGNFTHLPNVDAALWLGNSIMPALRKCYPGVRLTLVGIYPPKPVQALACEDILVTGAVPEIEPYFARAAVVIAPLRTGGGMRMKVLQAMALGKAVVTTSRGADGLKVGDRPPPIIIADDDDSIAEAAASLLVSRKMRCSLGSRARAYAAENFSAKAYARRIEANYVELQSKQPVKKQGQDA